MKEYLVKLEKEASWLITPRQTLQERDKIVCSNCGGNALYSLDEDLNLERALSNYCPHCGSLIVSADIWTKDEE